MGRTLKIGIAPFAVIKARSLDIAHGRYKPGPDDPKIWFSSMESLARVLSTNNQMLLEIISKEKPSSLADLAELAGRAVSNLSRTLKTMERYGLVELSKKEGRLIPRVTFDHLRLDLDLKAKHQVSA